MKENITELDDIAACDVAQLISGSFTFPLYKALLEADCDLDVLALQLEKMYNKKEHFGVVCVIFILSNAVGYNLPAEFFQMCSDFRAIPAMSSAIVDDWLEYAIEDVVMDFGTS